MNTVVSEDEMIATFLAAELHSPRFGEGVRAALRHRGWSGAVVSDPNLLDPAENRMRRQVLEASRGYASRTGLFDGFPQGVQWSRVTLSPTELASIRYTDFVYWVELSGGSRLPADAAVSISAGRSAFGQSNDPFLVAAAAVRRGRHLPPIIVVGTNARHLVVLEGHLRLTAYALCHFSTPVTALVGLSSELDRWSLY